MAQKGGMTCWKNCRSCGEVTTCFQRLLSIPSGMDDACKSQMEEIMRAMLTRCRDCCKNETQPHCQTCAKECELLLKELHQLPRSIETVESSFGKAPLPGTKACCK